MADYLVQEENALDQFNLEEGTGQIMLEESAPAPTAQAGSARKRAQAIELMRRQKTRRRRSRGRK